MVFIKTASIRGWLYLRAGYLEYKFARVIIEGGLYSRASSD